MARKHREQEGQSDLRQPLRVVATAAGTTALVLITGFLAIRSVGPWRSVLELQAMSAGLRRAASSEVTVSGSPLRVDASALLRCDPDLPPATDLGAVFALVLGPEGTSPVYASLWRGFINDSRWDVSRVAWLISEQPSSSAVPPRGTPSVYACTIRDPAQFVERTGIIAAPAAFYFVGRRLDLMASGPIDESVVRQFKARMADGQPPPLRTPFIWDEPGSPLVRTSAGR